MKANLMIQMDNAAFEDNEISELARILRTLADKLEANNYDPPAIDSNGNKVGRLFITP